MSAPLSAQLPTDVAALARLIIFSHQQLTGRPLWPEDDAAGLDAAPFVVLAHDASADPRFVYANRAALQRFAMTREQLIGLPSRLSAEAPVREERQRLLDAVAARGYIDDYRGVRVDRLGRRFEIHRATVWNLIDAGGSVVGQAASFAEWTDLSA